MQYIKNTKCRKTRAVAALAVMLCISFFLGGCATRVVFTTGFAKNEVFRIEDASCKKAEIMVYLSTIQNQYEDVYGKEIWQVSLDGVTLEENVKDTVLARIAQIKTMNLLAKKKGVILEEAQEAKAAQAADAYFASLAEKEVELLGISRSQILEMYREYALADKVYQEIIRDINPEISDDEARIIKVQHIFFSTGQKDVAGGRKPYSESEKQKIYDKACQVRELAMDEKQDFAELAGQYSDDSTITLSFGKGEIDAEFEAASFNLETNEISRVVESGTGYHIIKCLSTFDRSETDANKLQIVEKRRKEVFGQEYDAFVDTLVRNLNDKLWDDISLIHDDALVTTNFFEVYDSYFAYS